MNTEHAGPWALSTSSKGKIEPKNVSGRTPDQIITDVENTWLKHTLIDTNIPAIDEHNPYGETYCCMDCFNVRLDALLESTENNLNNLIRGTI